MIENPFGHLAIRVGGTVYSANHLAAREIDPNLLQHLSLADYLYGVQRPSPSQVTPALMEWPMAEQRLD